MKDADFRVLIATVPLTKKNSTHRTSQKVREPKRSTVSGARADALLSPQPIDAAFATNETELIDAPMWPLHSAHWFQPELAPSIPVWTGLAIARHHRIPAPGFLPSDITSPNRPVALDSTFASTLDGSRDALSSGARRELPQSGLAPLGWDARAVCRKQGGK